MTWTQVLASVLFIGAYVLIALQVYDKTRIALAGGALMLLLGLVDQHTAFHGTEHIHGIDWNTIFLLIGMMIIVGITKHTGVFQWIAIRAAKRVRAHPLGIMIILSLVTAVASAFLDNVTTVLLISPVILILTSQLRTDPVPYLIAIVLASNIGGTATLVGDPPNIMIASAAELGFIHFLRYDAPAVVLILATFVLMLWLFLGPRIKVSLRDRARVLRMDEARAILDPNLLRKCLFVLALVLLGFLVHSYLGLEPATIALAGAALLLMLLGRKPKLVAADELMGSQGELHWYHTIEWGTIFFFIGLFIMVAGLVELGVIAMLGKALLHATGGHVPALTMLILVFSAAASGVIDNIPFVATMNALILGLDPNMLTAVPSHVPPTAHHPGVFPLWWALSLGACLGGNFTLVGASANVVVAGIASRDGYHIDFLRFMKYGVPVTLMSIAISAVYLWFVFLRP
ncbi:MAG: ArsB/NhaD family transporter [Armatimonadetes bacterium]|nr:ArsB/NhaD family transporter [Armatimonadota bacterium]